MSTRYICWLLQLMGVVMVVVVGVLFLSIHAWTPVWCEKRILSALHKDCYPRDSIFRSPPLPFSFLVLNACLLPPQSTHHYAPSSSDLCSVPRRINISIVNWKMVSFLLNIKCWKSLDLHVLNGLFGQKGDWRSLVPLCCVAAGFS